MIAAIGAGAMVLAFASGYKVSSWRCSAKLADIQAQAYQSAKIANARYKSLQAQQEAATVEVEKADAQRQVEREIVDREVIKEVIRYVQTPNATSCGIDNNGVRLHDAAARGRMPEDPETSAESDDPGPGASNAELLETVTINYATYRAIKDRLTALQAWVDTLHRVKSE